MSFKLVNDFSIFSPSDRVDKIKVHQRIAKFLVSFPSPFIEKPKELSSGIIGQWDSIPIEVDDVIEGDYEIVWKENEQCTD